MSMLSSAFKKVTGQRLSTVVATGALGQNRSAQQLAGGGSILLLAAVVAFGYFLLTKKKG